MRQYFGTDGIRGTANKAPMTPDIMMKLAAATGSYFKTDQSHPKVIIGKDTRLSGYMIEPALVAGFVAVGMDVTLVGPLPTPAVSMLVRSLRADLGVVISASHNPFEDNGVKFFDRDGFKLSDEVEIQIESRMNGEIHGLVSAVALGRAKRLEDAPGRYIEYVKNTFPKNLRLDGLKIVVDCAHGAAYKVAPAVFWELGAEIISIGDNPDGFNINKDCGATHIRTLQQAVLSHHADLGIALDGDADRLVMVDEKAQVLDGDQLLALIIQSWHQEGRVQGGVVGTVMANLGFERFVQSLGLEFIRTAVGDRYVSEYMRQHHCNIGGEQSGHIILSDYSCTGDGLIAALQGLAVIIRRQKRASDFSRLFTPVPQLLKNIRFKQSNPLEHSHVIDAIQQAETQLGDKGRLVIRKSGTEPLLRLMAQGDDEDFLDALLTTIITTIQQNDGA